MALAPPPFRFSARRTRIDWQTLHGVDIQRLVGLLYLHQPNAYLSMLVLSKKKLRAVLRASKAG